MKLSDFTTESFKHYTVKHKKSGKEYKVTAMHKNSALDKARAQHGGTASRYTGTSTNDFEVVEGKSPHKKGTKKYKKHMAAMHAESTNMQDMFKELRIDDNTYISDGNKELTPAEVGSGFWSLGYDRSGSCFEMSKISKEHAKNNITGSGEYKVADADITDFGGARYYYNENMPDSGVLNIKSSMGEVSVGAPDYNPSRGGYSDNMIGEPDNYYDAEERQEAYDKMQDDLDRFDRNDQEMIKQGICPGCGGNGFMDGEEEMYNDETGEYEEGTECDGVGIFGCDQGEVTGADWLEIVKHDESNAERQQSKADYPGDEVVVKQLAKVLPHMRDPRMAGQQLKADYPFMGVAQRGSLVGKAMAMAFPREGAMEMPTVKNTPQENDVCKILGKALNKDEQEACEYSPQELYSELESINPELADTIARLSKIVYDVRLEERVYKDTGVPDVQKDPRGKEFKFDKDAKQFKSGDGELADIKTKLGKDLMKKRKSAMRKSTPSYGKKPTPKKPGFIASLFNDIEG